MQNQTYLLLRSDCLLDCSLSQPQQAAALLPPAPPPPDSDLYDYSSNWSEGLEAMSIDQTCVSCMHLLKKKKQTATTIAPQSDQRRMFSPRTLCLPFVDLIIILLDTTLDCAHHQGDYRVHSVIRSFIHSKHLFALRSLCDASWAKSSIISSLSLRSSGSSATLLAAFSNREDHASTVASATAVAAASV